MNEFTYNASALGAGGVFRNGAITTVIPSIASVALAPTGGEGKSIVSNYFSEELSFSYAETRVTGSVNDGKHTTQTYVYITDLRVFDKLEIEELKGVVTSIHGDREDEDHEFTLQATYKNVRALGQLVVPIDDVCVKSLKRYKDLQDVIQMVQGAEGVTVSDDVALPTSGDELAERFGANLKDLETSLKASRPLQGTLVEKVVGELPAAAASRKHHKVFINGLGTVRFGELMLKPGRRRVNLLRIAFANEIDGSESLAADRGALTIASVEGNGTPIYP